DDQRAHAGIAVRRHEAERDQFAERLLDLRLEETAAFRELVEKRSAMLLDDRHDGTGTRAGLRRVGGRRQGGPDGRVAAREKGDRGRAYGGDASALAVGAR